MSYQEVVDVYGSQELRMRVTACAATEGVPDPYSFIAQNEWQLAAQPGWAAAWGSAVLAELQGELGSRADVITDAMILAAVQALSATQAPEA